MRSRTWPIPAAERVHLIQTLYAAGLSSRTILDLLPYVDAKGNTPASRALLRTERDSIDQRISELFAARERLDAVITYSESPAGGCTHVDLAVPLGGPEAVASVT
ncbi:hypothetical protein GCM10027615_37620 [Plantactinospora veratri]